MDVFCVGTKTDAAAQEITFKYVWSGLVHTFQGKADKERKVEGVKGGWDQKVVGMILEEMKRVIREENTSTFQPGAGPFTA